MNGPVTGPLIGGFAAEYLGWRWTNWLVMIFSGVGWFMCASIKETYAPVILQRKAAKMRKETGDDRWWCRYDEKSSCKPLWTFFSAGKLTTNSVVFEILKVNLSRPFVLTFTEPILWFWNAYIAVGLRFPLLFLPQESYFNVLCGCEIVARFFTILSKTTKPDSVFR